MEHPSTRRRDELIPFGHGWVVRPAGHGRAVFARRPCCELDFVKELATLSPLALEELAQLEALTMDSACAYARAGLTQGSDDEIRRGYHESLADLGAGREENAGASIERRRRERAALADLRSLGFNQEDMEETCPR